MPLDLSTFTFPTAPTTLVLAPVATADNAKLMSALFSLSAEHSDDYQKWINVAIALKHAGEQYFSAFDAFSQRSSKYQGIDDCRKKWDAIKNNHEKPRTIASIYHDAKQHGWKWRELSGSPSDSQERYPTMSMQSLLSADFTEKYIVEDVLIKGMPAVWGGASKSMKTAMLLDLAFSLAVGRPYLGRFPCEKCKVLMLTGESGKFAVQRRLKMFVNNSEVVADDDYFQISESLPRFKSESDMSLLLSLLETQGTEVIIVDPLYLCLGDSDGSSLNSQGVPLLAISEVCRKAGVTIVVAHHSTKTAAREVGRKMKLEDLTQAGVAEWARQWWLISRREEFTLGSGLHQLHVNMGNCSSHSAEWAIDIDEGTRNDPRWNVTVQCASDLEAVDKCRKLDAKVAEDIENVRRVLTEPMSQTDLRDKAHVSPARWKKYTLPALLTQQVVKAIAGKRANAPHYVLVGASQ